MSAKLLGLCLMFGILSQNKASHLSVENTREHSTSSEFLTPTDIIIHPFDSFVDTYAKIFEEIFSQSLDNERKERCTDMWDILTFIIFGKCCKCAHDMISKPLNQKVEKLDPGIWKPSQDIISAVKDYFSKIRDALIQALECQDTTKPYPRISITDIANTF